VLAPLALVLLVSLYADEAAAKRARLAILPVTGDGVLIDDLAPVEDALRGGAGDLDRYRLLSRENTLAELEGGRELGLHCRPNQTACLVRFGLVAEIDLLIVPRAAQEGSFLLVTASLIDVKEEREVGRVGRIVDRRSVGDSVGRLAAELLEMPPDEGTVVLTIAPEGAVVEIDGDVRGRAPLRAPVSGLAAGEHELLVRLDGYRSVRARIDVRPRAVQGYVVELSARSRATVAGAERTAAPARRRLDAAPVRRAAAAPAAASEEPLDPRLVGGGVTVGIGVAALLSAGVLAMLAQTSDDPGLTRGGALVAATAGVLLTAGGLTFVGVALVE
jgi:hypothetical protein